MQPLINGCGTVFIAGYNAAVKVDGFVFIPCNSLASAASTYVAQNVGAAKPERVKAGVRDTILLSAALCAALCLAALSLGGENQLRLYALLGMVCGAGIYCLGVRRIGLGILQWLKKAFGKKRGSG